MKSLLMLAAIAVASLSIVSCDDDPWDDPYSHWHGWGDGYNQEETTIYDEADALCGEWYGPVEYTYRDGDGYSIAQFYANMRFARYNTNSAKVQVSKLIMFIMKMVPLQTLKHCSSLGKF